ncbi:MAG: hypothetical protein ACKOX7_02275 [Bacteroidota bacterium]
MTIRNIDSQFVFGFFKRGSLVIAVVLLSIMSLESLGFDVAGLIQDSSDDAKNIKVALVMPFEVARNEELDPANSDGPWIHPFSLPSLHFYEGARLALDSLDQLGLNCKITCFEPPTDSVGITRLINELKREGFDLLVGSFSEKLLHHVVRKTEAVGVKLLLTQAMSSEPVKGKGNCALAYASTATQCSLVVERFKKKYPSSNFIVIKGKSPREKELSDVFRAAASKHHSVKMVDLSVSGVSSVSDGISTSRQNIVLFVSSEESIVNSGVITLAKVCPKNTIICGMPTWLNFESIEFLSVKGVRISLFDNNFIDYESPERAEFRKRFVKTYFDDPLASGYAGFDVFTQILPLIAKEPKTDLDDLLNNRTKFSGRPFEFKKLLNGGAENHNITLTFLSDYRVIDMDDPEFDIDETDSK